MARKKIIAGNWKMNMTPSEAVALIETLKPLVATEDADVYRLSILFRPWKRQKAPISASAQKICILRKKAPLPARFPRLC